MTETPKKLPAKKPPASKRESKFHLKASVTSFEVSASGTAAVVAVLIIAVIALMLRYAPMLQ